MAYTVPFIGDLIKTYPTFDSLRDYLRNKCFLDVIDCSSGGALLHQRQQFPESLTRETCSSGGSLLHIFRYDKTGPRSDMSHIFRSVVWDAQTNRPVCVAPFRAAEGEPPSEAVCEEFLEGVMVNAFLDSSGEVRLATRSKLDATGTFYSSRSFQSLLVDALVAKGFTGLSDLKPILEAHGATFMSLLLQHPEHRIVARLTTPNVYIIHTGSVDSEGQVHIQERTTDSRFAIPVVPNPENIPLTQLVIQLSEKNGWQWQGLVLKDGHGKRWRLRSKSYTMVRTLRGDSPRKDVQFLKLREKQMMETYLYYYPEEAGLMRGYEQKLRELTQQLYKLYVTVHIAHSIPFTNAPSHWKTHIYSLHNYYLNQLKPRNFFIRKQEVIQYMNHMPIPRILHLWKSEATASASASIQGFSIQGHPQVLVQMQTE